MSIWTLVLSFCASSTWARFRTILKLLDLVCTQVGLEAIENKRRQLTVEVGHSPPDLTKLHLLLQGSISAQVGGVM